MEDGIYVPLSERTLRKLDQLERWFAASGEGYSEDRIIGMALDNMLACIRQGENDNFPETTPSVSQPSSSGMEGRSALGASNSESRPEL
jgi:hypothetical protein